MSTKRRQLEKGLRLLTSRDPEDLVRTEQLGARLDFREHESLFERALKPFRELERADLSNLPDSQIDRLQSAARRVQEAFEGIESFAPDGPNPVEERAHLVGSLELAYDQVFSEVVASLAFLSSLSSDRERAREVVASLAGEVQELKARVASELESSQRAADERLRRSQDEVGAALHEFQQKARADLNSFLKKAEEDQRELHGEAGARIRISEKEAESALRALQERTASDLGALHEKVEKNQVALEREVGSKLRRYEGEAESVVRNLRKAATATAASDHAKTFHEEAEGHARAKKKWLRVSVWVAVLAGGVALLNVAFLVTPLADRDVDPGRAIELGVARILLFSVLYYALVWVVRMYRAASHNEVVNRHRANALRTFEAFVATSEDDQAREAVLLRATECVFGHQVSGFADSGREDGGPSRLMEVVRGVRPGSEER